MSLSIKLGLLALVSTVAAAPSYGHGRFHNGGAGGAHGKYPSRGWGGYNTTVVGTGTGVAAPTGVEGDTTITSTLYSTTTVYSTIHRPKSKPTIVHSNRVEAIHPPPATDSGEGVCGPATVTVTATDRVTVTVPAGGATESSTLSPPQDIPSSVESSPAPSFTPVLSISIPNKGETTPVEAPTPIPTSAEEQKSSSPAPELTTEVSAPSSSAAAPSAPSPSAKPSSSPGYSGVKRGLSYNTVEALGLLSSGKFGWAMNWGQLPGDWGHSLDDLSKLNGANFIPMMHNPKTDGSASEFAKNVDICVKQGSTAVMGFNEVDHAEQALMTPGEACKYWAEYMDPVMQAHPELTVIGPSVTNGPAPMGLDWLTRFEKECPSAKYHITNIHFYDIYNEESATIPKGTAQRFIDHVKTAISTYGKPVFVSEFGVSSGTDEQAAKFLKTVMEWMDGEPQVKGYAYFMAKEVPLGLIKSNRLSCRRGLCFVDAGPIYHAISVASKVGRREYGGVRFGACRNPLFGCYFGTSRSGSELTWDQEHREGKSCQVAVARFLLVTYGWCWPHGQSVEQCA